MTYLQRIHAVQNLMLNLVDLCILTANTDLLVTMDMRVVIHKKLLNLNFSHKIIFSVAAATALSASSVPVSSPTPVDSETRNTLIYLQKEKTELGLFH